MDEEDLLSVEPDQDDHEPRPSSSNGFLPTAKTELSLREPFRKRTKEKSAFDSVLSIVDGMGDSAGPSCHKRKGSDDDPFNKKSRVELAAHSMTLRPRGSRLCMDTLDRSINNDVRVGNEYDELAQFSSGDVRVVRIGGPRRRPIMDDDSDEDMDICQPGSSNSDMLQESLNQLLGPDSRVLMESMAHIPREDPPPVFSPPTEAEEDWIDTFKMMNLRGQKRALFHLLTGVCESDHMRHIRDTIEPFFQRDFLSQLPTELGLKILDSLTPDIVCKITQVSRRWAELCDDEVLWKKKCSEECISFSAAVPSRRFTGAWEQQPGVMNARSVCIPWHLMDDEVAEHRCQRAVLYGNLYDRAPHKALYLRSASIVNNWRKKKIAGTCLFKGHEDHVITCLQLQGDMIVTGSDDNTLKVWSIANPVARNGDESPHLRFTLNGHTGGVWTSQVSADGKYIVSGSTDRTVRVWETETGTQLHCLSGHTSTVRCMALVGTTLVSGSRDTSLRVWDIEKGGEAIQILLGHVAAVRCVQFDGKRVASGAYDFTVKIWNAFTGECIHTLHGHTNRVYSLIMEADRNLVVSGSLDTTIRVWDMVTGACICNLVGHTSLTSGMQLKGDILVSCNADSFIRVWNIKENQCMHRLGGVPHGHASAITSLQFLDSGLVATSSDDGTVKLWDVTKGTFVRDLVRLTTGGSGGCIWRLKATDTLLVCAVGSRNGTEDTKLILLDFDASYP